MLHEKGNFFPSESFIPIKIKFGGDLVRVMTENHVALWIRVTKSASVRINAFHAWLSDGSI